MENELKNLTKVTVSIVASLLYTYFIASKISKGHLRLLSLLPILSLFTLLPLSHSSFLLRGTTTFFITWLCNFKLILFAFNLGPLSWDPSNPKPIFLFISIASLPIKIDSNPQKSQRPIIFFAVLGLKVLVFAILAPLKGYFGPKTELVWLCCMVFLFVEILLALGNFVGRAVVGLELEPPSNEPYLATSLQDFWGRRWNLMVTNILRHTVYKPVRSSFTATLGRRGAQVVAIMAAFGISGLMHELLFYNITCATPTWEVTYFFILHGVSVVLEVGLKTVFRHKFRLHRVVSTPLTLGFVMGTSGSLFFPQVLRNGADVKAIDELKFLVGFVRKVFKYEI